MSGSVRARVQQLLPEPVKGVAGRVFGRTMDRLAVPPSGLRGGRTLRQGRGDELPAVLILHLGDPDEETVGATVAVLERLAAVAGVRPVVVLDCGRLAVVRRAGFAVDHVPSSRDWARRHPQVPYAEHLALRLTGLRADYATGHLVTVPTVGLSALPDAEVSALLRPPRATRGRRLWQPLAVRAEALIDRSG